MELLEQIYYVVDKYLMSVSLSKKPGKLTSNLLSSMEDVRFLTQLYASGCTESWNKDKDLEAVSNRSISLILQNKKIRNKQKLKKQFIKIWMCQMTQTKS